MKTEEHQPVPVSGRLPSYTLPDLRVSTYIMGQYLHLLSIQTSQTVDFTDFLLDESTVFWPTCQKNTGVTYGRT
jgi:hypothetical protein